MATNNVNFKVKNGLDAGGDITTTGFLKSTNSSGDEGGQIDLAKAATNTTLTTGITIDVFQNKLRLFETGGTNRGFYIDMTTGGASVGSNLVGGGSYTLPVATATVLGGIELISNTTAGVAEAVTTATSRTYGIQVNSSNQAVVNVPWTDWYPTTFAWTGGTTSGPTGSLTGSGMSAVSYAAIPSASGTASGIVTTGSQTFAGIKTFNNNILLPNGTGLLSITGPTGTTIIDSVSMTTSGLMSAESATFCGGFGSTGASIDSSGFITTDGRVGAGKSSLTDYQTTDGALMIPDGRLLLTADNLVPLSLSRKTANGTVVQFFRGSTTTVGTISITTTATAYNTSSDYRLKENVVAIGDPCERVKALKPVRFNFIHDEDNETVDGFLAHEAQEVVPNSVTGVKDEVDADGEPVYQSIDHSKLIPLLTAALQDALKRIEALENK